MLTSSSTNFGQSKGLQFSNICPPPNHCGPPSASLTKAGTLIDRNGEILGSYFFSVTFCCLAILWYGCLCKTSLYELQWVLLHSEQQLACPGYDTRTDARRQRYLHLDEVRVGAAAAPEIASVAVDSRRSGAAPEPSASHCRHSTPCK